MKPKIVANVEVPAELIKALSTKFKDVDAFVHTPLAFSSITASKKARCDLILVSCLVVKCAHLETPLRCAVYKPSAKTVYFDFVPQVLNVTDTVPAEAPALRMLRSDDNTLVFDEHAGDKHLSYPLARSARERSERRDLDLDDYTGYTMVCFNGVADTSLSALRTLVMCLLGDDAEGKGTNATLISHKGDIYIAWRDYDTCSIVFWDLRK